MALKDDVEQALQRVSANGNGEFEAEFLFRAEAPFFEGHFPDLPLVPGVVQIEMVRMATEKVIGESLSIAAVNDCKFRRQLEPNQPVLLRASCSSVDGSVNAAGTLVIENEVAAELKISFQKGQKS
jgi:3-hydroxyacyl-[acyl-carrier-protein] dehydratase